MKCSSFTVIKVVKLHSREKLKIEKNLTILVFQNNFSHIRKSTVKSSAKKISADDNVS